MTKVVIVGLTNEAINSCILLASLDYQVVLASDDKAVSDFLATYQFDKQVTMLWQFYCDDQKIIINGDNDWVKNTKQTNKPDNQASNNQVLNNQALNRNDGNKDRIFWTFLDDDTAIDWVNQMQFLPSDKLILSGSGDIGLFDELSHRINSVWVYYLPFVFMKEGANFNSFFHSDLVLVGEKIANSYQKIPIIEFFVKHTQKYFVAPIKTIEFGRIAIMAMLATRLSFINELARLADSHFVDIKAIERLMGQDVRIGDKYLQAGWGFGGKSLPQELSRLIGAFDDAQVDTTLLKAVSSINDDQKELIFRKFWQYFDGDIDNKTVMIWGAGYRAKAGLTTNSAIHTLLPLLWSYDIKTVVYAEHTFDEMMTLYEKNPLFQITTNPYDFDGISALFVMNWSSLIPPDVAQINQTGTPVFDGKNVFSDAMIQALLGDYIGIGRPKTLK